MNNTYAYILAALLTALILVLCWAARRPMRCDISDLRQAAGSDSLEWPISMPKVGHPRSERPATRTSIEQCRDFLNVAIDEDLEPGSVLICVRRFMDTTEAAMRPAVAAPAAAPAPSPMMMAPMAAASMAPPAMMAPPMAPPTPMPTPALESLLPRPGMPPPMPAPDLIASQPPAIPAIPMPSPSAL